jgi:hypothetical protein
MDHITKVDSNAKLHLALVRQLGVLGLKFLLDFDRTAHCVYHTGKFCQYVVAWRVHHSASVFLDDFGDNLPVSGNGTDGVLVVFTHEATISFDIGTEDGGKLTFEVLAGHAGTSLHIKEDKLTRSVSFSVAMAGQVKK